MVRECVLLLISCIHYHAHGVIQGVLTFVSAIVIQLALILDEQMMLQLGPSQQLSFSGGVMHQLQITEINTRVTQGEQEVLAELNVCN
jgi:hypothetical protein